MIYSRHLVCKQQEGDYKIFLFFLLHRTSVRFESVLASISVQLGINVLQDESFDIGGVSFMTIN